jgi:hypothetical protein
MAPPPVVLTWVRESYQDILNHGKGTRTPTRGAIQKGNPGTEKSRVSELRRRGFGDVTEQPLFFLLGVTLSLQYPPSISECRDRLVVGCREGQ